MCKLRPRWDFVRLASQNGIITRFFVSHQHGGGGIRIGRLRIGRRCPPDVPSTTATRESQHCDSGPGPTQFAGRYARGSASSRAPSWPPWHALSSTRRRSAGLSGSGAGAFSSTSWTWRPLIHTRNDWPRISTSSSFHEPNGLSSGAVAGSVSFSFPCGRFLIAPVGSRPVRFRSSANWICSCSEALPSVSNRTPKPPSPSLAS